MKIKVKLGKEIIQQSSEIQNNEWIDETIKLWNSIPKPVKEQFQEDYAVAAAQRIKELSNCVDFKSKRKLLTLQGIFNDNSINCPISEQFQDTFLKTGFMRQELYVLSGISGGGKTALGILITAVLCGGYNSFLSNPTLKKVPVIYVSLEQTKTQIKARLICNSLFFSQHKLEILNGGNFQHSDFNLLLSLLEVMPSKSENNRQI